MKTKSFKDLIVWQKAYYLVKEIYKITKEFPKDEIYSLSQHNKEYKQFLSVAYGSLCELETQYLLSIDIGYINKNDSIDNLMKEVGSMLYCMLNPKR